MIYPLLLGLGVGLAVGLKAGVWWGKTSTWLFINKGLNDDRTERKRNS